MIQIIDGKIYDTATAKRICAFPGSRGVVGCGWNDTSLYHTKNDRYFLLIFGRPASRWAKWLHAEHIEHSRIRPITRAEALKYAESSELTAVALIAAGFEIEEG